MLSSVNKQLSLRGHGKTEDISLLVVTKTHNNNSFAIRKNAPRNSSLTISCSTTLTARIRGFMRCLTEAFET